MGKAIEALAEYLTGANVVHHSIGLELEGRPRERANEFFALRDALGLTGYVRKGEAVHIIWQTISREVTP